VDGSSLLTVSGFTAAFGVGLVVFGYLAYIRFFRRFVVRSQPVLLLPTNFPYILAYF